MERKLRKGVVLTNPLFLHSVVFQILQLLNSYYPSNANLASHRNGVLLVPKDVVYNQVSLVVNCECLIDSFLKNINTCILYIMSLYQSLQ